MQSMIANRRMAESFWVELLDLFRKHQVSALSRNYEGQPGRVVLVYDEALGKGEFFVSNVRVVAEDRSSVSLPGSKNLAVHVHDVAIEVVPRYSVRGLLHYATGLAKHLVQR